MKIETLGDECHELMQKLRSRHHKEVDASRGLHQSYKETITFNSKNNNNNYFIMGIVPFSPVVGIPPPT